MNPNFQQQLAELIQHNQQNPNNQMFFLINATNDNFFTLYIINILIIIKLKQKC